MKINFGFSAKKIHANSEVKVTEKKAFTLPKKDNKTFSFTAENSVELPSKFDSDSYKDYIDSLEIVTNNSKREVMPRMPDLSQNEDFAYNDTLLGIEESLIDNGNMIATRQKELDQANDIITRLEDKDIYAGIVSGSSNLEDVYGYGHHDLDYYLEFKTFLKTDIAELKEGRETLKASAECIVNSYYEEKINSPEASAYLNELTNQKIAFNSIAKKLNISGGFNLSKIDFEQEMLSLLTNNEAIKITSDGINLYVSYDGKPSVLMTKEMEHNLIYNILEYAATLNNDDRLILLNYMSSGSGAFYQLISQKFPDFNLLFKDVAYMSKEELGLYFYLLNIYDYEGADVYFDFKENELNTREGYLKAEAFLEDLSAKVDLNTLQKQYNETDEAYAIRLSNEIRKVNPSFADTAKTINGGLKDGVQNWINGIEAIFEDKGIYTSDQYKTMFIAEYLNAVYNGSFMTGTYNISSSIGNMLPSILISVTSGIILSGIAATTTTATAATTASSVKASKIMGTLAMGFSVAGNVKEQGLISGMDYYQARLYGLIIGLSETILGYLIGGIPGLSALSKLPGLYGTIVDVFGEGLEEGLQEIIDALTISAITGKEVELDFGQVFKAGEYGAITAIIMNMFKIVGGVATIKADTQKMVNLSKVLGTFNNAEKAALNNIDISNPINNAKVKEATSLIKAGDIEGARTILNDFLLNNINEIKNRQTIGVVYDGENTGEIIPISLLMNIIKDDATFELFIKDYYDNPQIFGDISRYQCAMAIDQLRNLINSNGYNFEFNKLQQARVNNIIANFTSRTGEFIEWTDSTMINQFENVYSKFLAKGQALKVKGSVELVESKQFKEIDYIKKNPNVQGFNNGNRSIITLGLPDMKLKSVIIHESVHQVSAGNKFAFTTDTKEMYVKRGFAMKMVVDGKYVEKRNTGLNEAATEYFTQYIMKENYPSGEHCQYQPAVRRLKQILDLNIEGFDHDALAEGYFGERTIYGLQEAIDTVAGDGFFKKELIPAFDEAASESMDTSKLDQIVIKLGDLVSQRKEWLNKWQTKN